MNALGRAEALWWDQAQASLDAPAPTFGGFAEVDVAVIGGGYVGLWTAIELKRRDPSCRVTLLEQKVCGAGASGRNNGFALSLWSKVGTLSKLIGSDAARQLAQASEDAIDDLEGFCRQEHIDASFRRSGWLWAATSRAQLGSWDSTLRDCKRLGVEPFQRLSAAEVNARVPSPRHLAGVFDAKAATLHPGRLVRGLRRVALDRGVQLHEHSRVTRIEAGQPATVRTARGQLQASQVVLAINAWAAGWPGLRRSVVGIATDGIATEPIPERLEEMGWTNGEGVTDSRQLIHVYRTSPDDRISFGSGGRGVAFGAQFGRRFRASARHAPGTVSEFRRVFPQLRDVATAYYWSAVIDRSPTGLPLLGRLGAAGNILYGVGWSGNGVAPSLLGGRILASTALGVADEWSSSPLFGAHQGSFPPEPVRFLGAQLVRRGVAAKETAEDEGRRVHPLATALSRLAPANIVPTQSTAPATPDLEVRDGRKA